MFVIEKELNQLKEEILKLENSLSNLLQKYNSTQAGTIIEETINGEKIKIFAPDGPNLIFRKLTKEHGNFYLNLPKKGEFKYLKNKYHNKKLEINAVYMHGKIITDKEQIQEIIREKEKINDIQNQIESLKNSLKEKEIEIEKRKREFLKEKKYKCSSCGGNVKSTKYLLPEKDLVLCSKCWKTPDYIHYFKETVTIGEVSKMLGLSFEELRNFEKAYKLHYNNSEEVPTKNLKSLLVQMLEEGKHLHYTKEFFEKVLNPLGVKKIWMNELEEEGIIHPAGKIEIQIKRNKWIDAKLWDDRTINRPEIENFISRKKISIQESKKRRSQTLKQVHQKIKEKKKEIEETLEILRTYHPFLETAFYLYHANHYAKTPKYRKYSTILYDLKKRALLKAYRENPELFEILFIDRGSKITYCEECREKAYYEWRTEGGYDSGYSFGEWLKEGFQKPCESCFIEEDYYSLVELKINTPIARFNFHLIYPEVKEIFNKKKLLKIELDREEAFLNFGRELEKYESLIVPLKKVISNLESF